MPKPRIPIDKELVFKMASVFCTNEEIASAIGCSKDTIEIRCKEELHGGRLKACRSLRSKQFELAMQGNVGMLIWLGKQYLGQSDKFQVGDEEGGGFTFVKHK